MTVYEIKVESRDPESGKIIKDVFMIEDNSTTGAEIRMHEYLEENSYNDFEVVQITKKKYSDVVLSKVQESEFEPEFSPVED